MTRRKHPEKYEKDFPFVEITILTSEVIHVDGCLRVRFLVFLDATSRSLSSLTRFYFYLIPLKNLRREFINMFSL